MSSALALHASGSNDEKNDEQAPSCNVIVPDNPPPHHHSGRRSRRKMNGDPDHPEPKWSGWHFFHAEKRSEFKYLHLKKRREFTRMIADSWNKLSLEEKAVYQNYAVKDKERYEKEMEEYKERTMTTSATEGAEEKEQAI